MVIHPTRKLFCAAGKTVSIIVICAEVRLCRALIYVQQNGNVFPKDNLFYFAWERMVYSREYITHFK